MYIPRAAVYFRHWVEAYPSQNSFFLTILSIIELYVAKGTFRPINVMYLYFSLPIKQYLNCWRNEIFFSVWVWAILWPDLRLSSEDLLSLTLTLKIIINQVAAAAPRFCFLLIPFHVHINLMPRFSSGSIKASLSESSLVRTVMMVNLNDKYFHKTFQLILYKFLRRSLARTYRQRLQRKWILLEQKF